MIDLYSKGITLKLRDIFNNIFHMIVARKLLKIMEKFITIRPFFLEVKRKYNYKAKKWRNTLVIEYHNAESHEFKSFI